jgi:hypothetical protein
MPARDVWDVVPSPDGWAVQREGTSKADSLHDSQDDAIARAADLARRARGQLRVKGGTAGSATSAPIRMIPTRRLAEQASDGYANCVE